MSAAAVSSPNRRTPTGEDWLAGIVMSILFVVMLIATWQRWTHPMIDHGREINLPARILSGEKLYTDISYHYGPFAPYFNAFLYRVFGLRMATLHTSGAVCAILILLMIYRLSRHLMACWEAVVATGLVLVTCALNASLGNYIQPYAYAALYGWTFAVASLVCLLRFLKCHQPRWMFWTGVGTGAAVICKPEFILLCTAPAGVGWALVSLEERRWLWRPAWLLAVPALAIGGLTYGVLVVQVSWQRLIGENYRMLSQPRFIYFAHVLNGTLEWPRTGWALIAAIGMTLFACGLTALMGLALAPKVESLWRGRARPAWGLLAVGWWLWSFQAKAPGLVDFNPLRGAPIVLLTTIVSITCQLWRARKRGERLPFRNQVLLIVAVFSLVGIYRVIFNVSLRTFYTPFTVPGLIIVYLYLFFKVSPALLLKTVGSREYARRSAVVLMAMVVAALAYHHAALARRRAVFKISAPRGQLLTHPMLGRPVAEAIHLAVARTAPTDYLASLPQGTIVNFLAERPNPFREENVVPGVLTPDREAEAIRRLAEHRVPLILIGNLLTPEYGDRVFGLDYNQQLMHWIEEHYDPVATFSTTEDRELRFGDDEFFIRAYERKPSLGQHAAK
jgi:Dolichyl-phosphate-mannose-protein mannosyltransferase